MRYEEENISLERKANKRRTEKYYVTSNKNIRSALTIPFHTFANNVSKNKKM